MLSGKQWDEQMREISLKKWTINGSIIGLLAALINILILGKGPHDLFALTSISYVLGHILGGAVLGLLAAVIGNAVMKR